MRALFGLLLLLVPVGLFAQTAQPARASFRVWVRSGGGMQGGSSTAIAPHIVVTNVHVVGSASVAEVSHPLLGLKLEGQVVARDPAADVALIYVPTGGLEWTPIGGDPQSGERCTLYGYGGGNSGLKAGTGHFVGAEGMRGGTSVPVWTAAVESISGDSGGGLFDDWGRLVAVNWGTDPASHESKSTPASYVLKLASSFHAACRGEAHLAQIFGGGGCWPGGGGICNPRGGGGLGGGGIMPPKQPISDLPPAAPHLPPSSPPATPPSSPPICNPLNLDELAEKIAAKLPQPKDGKDGAPGPAGPPGPAGQDAPPLDLDELAELMIRRLPPIHVQNYDANGKLVDEERYPYPGPIRLKLRPTPISAPK